MSSSRLGTMVATLVVAAGFLALAASADAQISGSIGGDVVGSDPVHVPGDPGITHTGTPVHTRAAIASYDYVTIFGTGIDVGGLGFGATSR